jgi:hypothetical protein
VPDNLRPGELHTVAREVARQTHGHQDLVVIQCVEELVEPEPQSVLELFHPSGCDCKICER